MFDSWLILDFLFSASQYCPSSLMFSAVYILNGNWPYQIYWRTFRTNWSINSCFQVSFIHSWWVILNGLISNVFLVLNSNWSFSPWTFGIRGWWKNICNFSINFKHFRKNNCIGMFWSENGEHRVFPDLTSWCKLKFQSLGVGSVLFISTETSYHCQRMAI